MICFPGDAVSLLVQAAASMRRLGEKNVDYRLKENNHIQISNVTESNGVRST